MQTPTPALRLLRCRMRDADKLREDGIRSVQPRTVAWLTVVGFGICAGIFGLGFVIGGRMARLDITHEPPLDLIARLDGQRKLHDELTFYDDLTALGRPRSAAQANTPKTPDPLSHPKAAAPADTTSTSTAAAVRAPPRPPVLRDQAQSPVVPGLHAGPARSGEYTVQVGSHQSAEEARAFCATLERKGFKPFIVKSDLGGRGVWHRVRVGRFTDELQAKQAKATLAQADVPAWVLRTE